MSEEKLHRQSLPAQLVVRLRREILSKSESGRRLEAEGELARRFAVSVRTVREALSELALEGLVVRRQGKGTFVSDLAGRLHIGLWFGIDPQLTGRADAARRILSETHRLLVEGGAAVKIYTICCGNDRPVLDTGYRGFCTDLDKGWLSAVGVIQGPFGSPEISLVRSHGVPMVLDGSDGLPDDGEIGLDTAGLVREGTRRLMAMGCRRIAWLGWMGYPSHEGRSRCEALKEVFRVTLSEKGAETHAAWFRGETSPTLPGAGYDAFREVWFSTAEKPDGLLVTDDVLLPDTVAAIVETGVRVPGQLKVVATANRGMLNCPFFPAMRMEVDLDEAAQLKSRMLLSLARGESVSSPKALYSFRWVETPLSRPVHRIQNLPMPVSA